MTLHDGGRDDEHTSRLLGAGEIRSLLEALADELASTGEQAEVFLVGGAAMALGYGARDATRDVDALFEPKLAVYGAAARVAALHDLRPDWLNDAVKGFLHGEDADRRLVLDHPALACTSPVRATCLR